MHALLDDQRLVDALKCMRDDTALPLDEQDLLLASLGLQREAIARLRTIWGAETAVRLLRMAEWRKRFAVRMLGGSLMDYERATLRWWFHIDDLLPQINFRDRADLLRFQQHAQSGQPVFWLCATQH